MSKFRGNRRVALIWLGLLHSSCNARISGGDLDLDDWVYRSRDAAEVLLKIWGEAVVE